MEWSKTSKSFLIQHEFVSWQSYHEICLDSFPEKNCNGQLSKKFPYQVNYSQMGVQCNWCIPVPLHKQTQSRLLELNFRLPITYKYRKSFDLFQFQRVFDRVKYIFTFTTLPLNELQAFTISCGLQFCWQVKYILSWGQSSLVYSCQLYCMLRFRVSLSMSELHEAFLVTICGLIVLFYINTQHVLNHVAVYVEKLTYA